MKKFLAFVFSFLSVLFLISSVSDSKAISAATTADDNNETFMTATNFSLKKPAKGQLADSEDIDWYKLKVEKAAAFRIKFTNFNSETGAWRINIYDNEVNQIDWFDTKTSNYLYSSSLYSVEKGTDIYVKVSTNYQTIGKDYQIEVEYLDEGYNWEKENNDDSSVATKLESGKARHGVISYSSNSDIDWYVYTVKSNDPFSFKFTNMDTETGTWRIEIFDKDLQKLGWNDILGTNYTYETDQFTYKKGDKIYIKISPNNLTKGKIYEIKAIDSSATTSTDDKSDSSDNSTLKTPYSVLAGTNVVVGKANAGATVNVTYGKKTYKATADSDGIYRVKTAKLKKGKKLTIWQTADKKDSEKISVKVVEKY